MQQNDVLKGLVEESKLILDALREDSRSADNLYYETAKLRRGIAKVLTKLDQELACKATGNVGIHTSATKELIRYGVIQLLFMNEFSGIWLFYSV